MSADAIIFFFMFTLKKYFMLKYLFFNFNSKSYIGYAKYLFFGKCFNKNYWIFSQISFFYLQVQSFRLIMENNFIQMAASADHAVVYTIDPIFEISEMIYCWERRWIDIDGASNTLSPTAARFSGARTVFGFSRFGLSMRMPVSFTFFSQDNEHTEPKVLLFFQNPYTKSKFAHVLQHYHDFESNVAIFPRVVQAY